MMVRCSSSSLSRTSQPVLMLCVRTAVVWWCEREWKSALRLGSRLLLQHFSSGLIRAAGLSGSPTYQQQARTDAASAVMKKPEAIRLFTALDASTAGPFYWSSVGLIFSFWRLIKKTNEWKVALSVLLKLYIYMHSPSWDSYHKRNYFSFLLERHKAVLF